MEVDGMPKKPLLMVFVRNFERGQVKKRLAASWGEEAALRFYKRLVACTHKVASLLDVSKWVCYSRFLPREDVFDRGGFLRKQQKGEHLGDRMQRAFAEGFSEGYAPILIIGSDCPALRLDHLEEALLCLREKDYVLGPARDGGYYLLGMRQYEASLFKNISWSTAQVLRQTLARMPVGSSYGLLPVLSDVDRAEDVEEDMLFL